MHRASLYVPPRPGDADRRRGGGLRTWLELVIVRSKEQSAINFRLERAASFLRVAGQPADAILFVDGAPRGRLPQQRELPGHHAVRVEAAGYSATEYAVDLTAGETKSLGEIALALADNGSASDSKMAPLPAPKARPWPAVATPAASPLPPPRPPVGTCSVSFNSIPISNVTVDGAPLGPTPILRTPLRAGPHTAQFTEGATRHPKQFACRAGTSKVVSLILTP